jgi:deazaflavin-dependent oxidoreductase (nitroreductase family)
VSAGRSLWREATAYASANRVQRAMRRLAASGPGSRVFAPVLHRLDRPVYRLTRGRATLGGLVSGLPVALLTTTGARSGVARTVPLLALPDADRLVVIASNWGRPGAPAWERNLRANPSATVSVHGVAFPVRAVELVGERRAEAWQAALEVYPGYAAYARRAGARPIGLYELREA